MTVAVLMLSLAPNPWESRIGSVVMKPIAAPIVGGMITSTIHVLIVVPVFFAIMKERALTKESLPQKSATIPQNAMGLSELYDARPGVHRVVVVRGKTQSAHSP